jgi:hypothetical protein
MMRVPTGYGVKTVSKQPSDGQFRITESERNAGKTVTQGVNADIFEAAAPDSQLE